MFFTKFFQVRQPTGPIWQHDAQSGPTHISVQHGPQPGAGPALQWALQQPGHAAAAAHAPGPVWTSGHAHPSAPTGWGVARPAGTNPVPGPAASVWGGGQRAVPGLPAGAGHVPGAEANPRHAWLPEALPRRFPP